MEDMNEQSARQQHTVLRIALCFFTYQCQYWSACADDALQNCHKHRPTTMPCKINLPISFRPLLLFNSLTG